MMRGAELAEAFYRETVRPVLDAHFPGLPHAAALLGPGSEVLGYDDATSRDHDWGPRLQLVLAPGDHAAYAVALRARLAEDLPPEFAGFPTRFAEPGADQIDNDQPDDDGGPGGPGGPPTHRVEVLTLAELAVRHLGAEGAVVVRGAVPPPAVWLSTPSQELLALTAGPVFADDVGLAQMRAVLAWYPHDVWLYLMAGCWSAIGEDEHLMPRAGHAGDDLGSRLVAARLVRTAMRLAFLQERRYAPYAKWFGTAFARLEPADELGGPLAAVLAADHWPERAEHLAHTLESLAHRHNGLGVGAPVPERTHPFFDRGFPVIDGTRIAQTVLAQVTDPVVARLAALRPVGGIDQLTESTDVLADPVWRAWVRPLWEA